MIAAEPRETSADQAPGPDVWRGRLRRAGVVVLIGVPLLAALSGSFPICPTAAALGIPCPGCGLTRATLALLTGHPVQALHLHPLVLLVAPIYGIMAAIGIFGYVRGPPTKPPGRLALALDRVLGPWATISIVLLLVVWLARFAGFFGGPVPVETFRHWASTHVTR